MKNLKSHLVKLGIAGVVVVGLCISGRSARADEPVLDPMRVRVMVNTILDHRNEKLCEKVAGAAYEVATHSPPLWKSDVSGKKTADFLVVFTAKESAGQETAFGDGGEAWGATQIHWRLWGPLLESWGTIGSIYDLFDMTSSMYSTLAIMRYLVGTCGSVKKAAYAYASGSCLGTIRGRNLVETRCALIGGC